MIARDEEQVRSALEGIEQHSAMNDEALGKRSDAFRRATQRKGMPVTYGTGKAGVGAELLKKVRKREAAEQKKREQEEGASS